ncbi:MAG TPA: efflux transporter outer membrane subunit [Micropepsaceae bacterium]|nr:efflux transporter outer membrane subunit [Micropepsaceae bacterium]
MLFKSDRVATLIVALLVGACATQPVGQQSSGIAVAPAWNAVQNSTLVTTSDQVDQQWWTHFSDPVLDGLIAEALANNRTLMIARERINEARADRVIARSALFPNVQADATTSRGNQGYLTGNRALNVAQADIQASWELDLFGRNQALTARAAAILQSVEAASQAVRVTLLADVARNYFDLRDYEMQLALTRENLALQQKTYELTNTQFQAGYSSEYDVQLAAAQVSATSAAIPPLQADFDAALNALNLLLGEPPGTVDARLKTPPALQPLDARVLIAAPARVLETRPDIRVAERQFAASISGRKAAVAQLYPDISLTGLFGVQGATGFGGTPWSIGSTLAQPILNFGRIEAQIDVADAQQKENFLNYQQVVLAALQDMENALSNYQHESLHYSTLTASVEHSQRAADLAQQQYTGGAFSLLDLLIIQRDLLAAEEARADSDVALRKDLVSIYTAAGGGWHDADTSTGPVASSH